jgi:hypothetical protein
MKTQPSMVDIESRSWALSNSSKRPPTGYIASSTTSPPPAAPHASSALATNSQLRTCAHDGGGGKISRMRSEEAWQSRLVTLEAQLRALDAL